MREKNSVLLCTKYACFSLKGSMLRKITEVNVTPCLYLHEDGVREILHEVVPRSSHKAHWVHHQLQVHIARHDLGLHNHHRDLLWDLQHLHKGLKGAVHRDPYLHRMEHQVVDVLLPDSPTVTSMDIIIQNCNKY